MIQIHLFLLCNCVGAQASHHLSKVIDSAMPERAASLEEETCNWWKNDNITVKFLQWQIQHQY